MRTQSFCVFALAALFGFLSLGCLLGLLLGRLFGHLFGFGGGGGGGFQSLGHGPCLGGLLVNLKASRSGG